VTAGLARLGIPVQDEGHQTIPTLSELPPAVREIVTSAYGEATGHIFWLALPFALVLLVSVVLLREVPLRTTVHSEEELEALR
jgi:hypothetical protein